MANRNFRQLKKAGCEVVPRKSFVFSHTVARYVSYCDEHQTVTRLVVKGGGHRAHYSYWALS